MSAVGTRYLGLLGAAIVTVGLAACSTNVSDSAVDLDPDSSAPASASESASASASASQPPVEATEPSVAQTLPPTNVTRTFTLDVPKLQSNDGKFYHCTIEGYLEPSDPGTLFGGEGNGQCKGDDPTPILVTLAMRDGMFNLIGANKDGIVLSVPHADITATNSDTAFDSAGDIGVIGRSAPAPGTTWSGLYGRNRATLTWNS